MSRMAFKVPVVEKCCCGCSLELGTKIIGFIHIFIIGGLFLTVFIFHIIDEYGRYIKGHEVYQDTFNAAFFRDEFLQMTIFGNVAFSACLLYGAYKRDSVFFEPFLILKTAVVVLGIFNVGIYLVVRAIGHKTIDIFLQLFNVENIQEEYDGYFKIRPVLKARRQNFLNIEAEDKQSIEERMIPFPFKGAHADIRRQYIKAQEKWEFELIIRADVSGIVYEFLIKV